MARDGFEAEPLHGSGAGTYRLLWERDRPAPPFKVIDGHSLYFEVAAELGVPGLVLLLVALVTPLAVALTRLRGDERHAYAAFARGGRRCCSSTPGSTGTGRCPRCSSGTSPPRASCSRGAAGRPLARRRRG